MYKRQGQHREALQHGRRPGLVVGHEVVGYPHAVEAGCLGGAGTRPQVRPGGRGGGAEGETPVGTPGLARGPVWREIDADALARRTRPAAAVPARIDRAGNDARGFGPTPTHDDAIEIRALPLAVVRHARVTLSAEVGLAAEWLRGKASIFAALFGPAARAAQATIAARGQGGSVDPTNLRGSGPEPARALVRDVGTGAADVSPRRDGSRAHAQLGAGPGLIGARAAQGQRAQQQAATDSDHWQVTMVLQFPMDLSSLG